MSNLIAKVNKIITTEERIDNELEPMINLVKIFPKITTKITLDTTTLIVEERWIPTKLAISTIDNVKQTHTIIDTPKLIKELKTP